ncbi:MAG: hypothetical protein JSU90_12750 [Nitrospiraceae bacterium]|nr:MAG: hypothetical protein JSU90_12750 [Nitrospiraceae bacterium]
MEISRKSKKREERVTWEEESGLISFLSSVQKQAESFNREFEFGVHSLASMPRDIDGDSELPRKVGFVLERRNPLLPELTYCLYSLLKGRDLYGYIGMYRDGSLTTLRELSPLKDFKKGKAVLYEWMRQLVRASCEKIML